jgi:replicative DNA helicase Mcm
MTIRFANDNSEDAPVPITWRKQEAIERLAEASARVRLSDEVTEADVERALRLVKKSMKQVGMDPDNGQYDADIIETGHSKSQRDRKKDVKSVIDDFEDEADAGAPISKVIAKCNERGHDPEKVESEIQELKDQGEVYEPKSDHLRAI